MHWDVQLIGDSADLSMLADRFTNPDLRVERRDQEFVISATAFEGLASEGEVRDRAKDIVVALSGFRSPCPRFQPSHRGRRRLSRP